MFRCINIRLKIMNSRAFYTFRHSGKEIHDFTKMIKQIQMHKNMYSNYTAVVKLPIPDNIDVAETTRFSPQRSRDISATVISQYDQEALASMSQFDITVDNSISASNTEQNNSIKDPHVQSYDCFGAVSLNSVMQSNVPSPFGGMHKFSHLNMPGGQWSQEGKFMSQHLQNSHYTALRESVRSDWISYNPDATINKNVHVTNMWNTPYLGKRGYCKKSDSKEKSAIENNAQQTANPSKKDQLKKAIKDYGATVIIFHIAISLISLGGFYALVSSGVDIAAVLKSIGVPSSYFSDKVATGASTFVVAYAVHKVFAPMRISITLASTPFIVRYLRLKGILKPEQKKKI